MINVLIVEDSLVVRELLIHILTSDPEINVIGAVGNGGDALKFVERNKPDVITMDINMPNMNGFETTRTIMETCPVPIVIVSASWDPKEVEKTFQSIEAGAVAALGKPVGAGHPDYKEQSDAVIQTVKLMSEVKVIKRVTRVKSKSVTPISDFPVKIESKVILQEIKLVAIGASTGGPQILQKILSGLSEDFPVPVLIVQHIAAGFIKGFIDWLNRTSRVPVDLAENGEQILNGRAYVAPDGAHLGIINGSKAGGQGADGRIQIVLSKDKPENFVRPSASYLFRSVANVVGVNSIGIILTGMGKDGAVELKLMKEKGAVTIAQDKESSVIHGMPGEAIKLGAATHVLSPDNIVLMLNSIVWHHKILQ